MTAKPLAGKVAVVAGATRGAGRGTAMALGDAGATVYCLGRSTRNGPSDIGRPECIEDTADMVRSRGGDAMAVQVDCSDSEQVKAFFDRLARERAGRIDLLVNNISGDQFIGHDILSGKVKQPFWDFPLEKGWRSIVAGVLTHITPSYFAAPLMVARGTGLIVEVTDGNEMRYNDCGVYYSMMKRAPQLLAYFMAQELKPHGVAVVSITPGWILSEKMLENLDLQPDILPDASRKTGELAKIETPLYVGRAVVALASDPNVMAKTGRSLSSGWLAKEYGFVDQDGRQPFWYTGEGVFDGGTYAIVGRDG